MISIGAPVYPAYPAYGYPVGGFGVGIDLPIGGGFGGWRGGFGGGRRYGGGGRR